jgi:hypothetical protein
MTTDDAAESTGHPQPLVDRHGTIDSCCSAQDALEQGKLLRSPLTPAMSLPHTGNFFRPCIRHWRTSAEQSQTIRMFCDWRSVRHLTTRRACCLRERRSGTLRLSMGLPKAAVGECLRTASEESFGGSFVRHGSCHPGQSRRRQRNWGRKPTLGRRSCYLVAVRGVHPMIRYARLSKACAGLILIGAALGGCAVAHWGTASPSRHSA